MGHKLYSRRVIWLSLGKTPPKWTLWNKNRDDCLGYPALLVHEAGCRDPSLGFARLRARIRGFRMTIQESQALSGPTLPQRTRKGWGTRALLKDVTNEGGKPRSRKARDLGHPQYDQLSVAGSQFSVCSLEEEVAEGAAAYRNKCQASR